jgi:hypothetical protein
VGLRGGVISVTSVVVPVVGAAGPGGGPLLLRRVRRCSWVAGGGSRRRRDSVGGGLGQEVLKLCEPCMDGLEGDLDELEEVSICSVWSGGSRDGEADCVIARVKGLDVHDV